MGGGKRERHWHPPSEYPKRDAELSARYVRRFQKSVCLHIRRNECVEFKSSAVDKSQRNDLAAERNATKQVLIFI